MQAENGGLTGSDLFGSVRLCLNRIVPDRTVCERVRRELTVVDFRTRSQPILIIVSG